MVHVLQRDDKVPHKTGQQDASKSGQDVTDKLTILLWPPGKLSFVDGAVQHEWGENWKEEMCYLVLETNRNLLLII